MTSRKYLKLAKETLSGLMIHLGLNDYPKGDESDLEQDDFVFGSLIAIDEALTQYDKDLKVLEVLKPLVKACLELNKKEINTAKLFTGVNTDKIIKEWLENEKNS